MANNKNKLLNNQNNNNSSNNNKGDPATSSDVHIIVPTIIDVPELIVTNEDNDFDDDDNYKFDTQGSIWSDQLQFISSALSYTVSLGNIWRFPYLCYRHGGGAFLMAYTIMLIIIGLPLFLMELAFGQYANEGPITIWRISPLFEGIGYSMCLISGLVALYYNMINAWMIYYLFASISFTGVPWRECNEAWARRPCHNMSQPEVPRSNLSLPCFPDDHPNQTVTIITSSSTTNNFNTSCLTNLTNGTVETAVNRSLERMVAPAQEYFHDSVLSISSGIDDMGHLRFDLALCLMLAWLVVFFGLSKGFKNLGKITLFMAIVMPYLALGVLLLRASSYEGYKDGISYYVTPQWNRMSDIGVWADAVMQIFFSLCPCWGGIITLASHNKFHNNFHSDTMLIGIANYVTSLFAGLVTFAILGFLAQERQLDIGSVAQNGVGLVFMVYTEALSRMALAPLCSIIFFSVILFLGFLSQMTLIETVIATIVNTWPHKLAYRKLLILLITCLTMFILGLFMCTQAGLYILQLLDNYCGTFSAMTIGLLETIVISWVYGMENFMQDIDDMIGSHKSLFPSRSYWYFMWRFLTPSFLFAILLFSVLDLPLLTYGQYTFPLWTSRFGIVIWLFTIAIIPVMAIIRFILAPSGSLSERILYLCRPSEDWAPSTYISGPKLINKHTIDSGDYHNHSSSLHSVSGGGGNGMSSGVNNRNNSQMPLSSSYDQEDDQESNDSNEDLKVVDGKANYIIPEDDDNDTALLTSNV